jgi:hypothetical protein
MDRVGSLDSVVLEHRAWLELTMLRFISHPRVRQVFPDYLIAVYHSMRGAGPVMEAARKRSVDLSAECAVAARLVDYWTRHIQEEEGHDQWMLMDLREIGVARSALSAPPIPEVAELLGTLHFWILHTHPVAALAYFYVVERDAPTEQFLDWLVHSAGIERAALRTFYRHAMIDVEHGRELEELVEGLPLTPSHLRLFLTSATTVVRQLARIMESHIDRANETSRSRATLQSRKQSRERKSEMSRQSPRALSTPRS